MSNRGNESNVGKSVAFLTLGCKVNSYETEAMEQLFIDAGYQITDFGGKADIYVVNTCTVTNIADRKSRQMLHKAKKSNPDSVVVAVGCYVQAAKEALEVDEAIDLLVGNNQKTQIVQLVENFFEDKDCRESIIDIDHDSIYEELSIGSISEKTRAYIKIQDGCNQFCSYCIIPYTRGRIRSRKQEDILSEVLRLVEKGYKEVVLTGIHLSSYGLDMEDNTKVYDSSIESSNTTPLLAIINEISSIEGIERIRLGSLEPRIITEEFVKTLSTNEKFCPHFHLSLQSGCDATLKRMNRKYDSKIFFEKCELLREHFNKPALTTDIIVGFPGETKEEFTTTQQYLEKVAFSKTHIFKYSKRKGTRAADMIDQIDDQTKSKRSEILIKLDNENNFKYKDSFLGKKDSILIEEEVTIEGKKYMVGHSKRYVKIAVISDTNLVNQIVSVNVISHLNDEILLGEIL
jgi:threonylcarbamoyladenosine tRNA methylthiotransferase MtaB